MADCPGVTLAAIGAAVIVKPGAAEPAPTPDKEIRCGDPLELSLISSCAEREPMAAGVKMTEIMQFAPAAIVPVHVFVWAKSAPFVPETIMLLTTRPLLPVFPNVIAIAGLATPTG